MTFPRWPHSLGREVCVGATLIAGLDPLNQRERNDVVASVERQEMSMSEQRQTPHTQRLRRVQRQRTKGWKMPENTVYVGRPGKFGNPWSPTGYWDAGYSGDVKVAAAACVEQYRAWLTQTRSSWSGDIPEAPWSLPGVPDSGRKIPALSELRGKNLACWCPLDQPCHADVLLELANAEGQP